LYLHLLSASQFLSSFIICLLIFTFTHYLLFNCYLYLLSTYKFLSSFIICLLIFIFTYYLLLNFYFYYLTSQFLSSIIICFLIFIFIFYLLLNFYIYLLSTSQFLSLSFYFYLLLNFYLHLLSPSQFLSLSIICFSVVISVHHMLLKCYLYLFLLLNYFTGRKDDDIFRWKARTEMLITIYISLWATYPRHLQILLRRSETGFSLGRGAWVQFRMTSCQIRDGRSGTTSGISANFLGFPLLVIISPLLHTHPSLSTGIWDRSEQAANYYSLCLYAGSLISDPALG
jgi:hypothetical protein